MKRNLMLVAVTMLLAATSCTASGNGANEKTVTSSVKEQLEKAKDERKTVFMIVTDSATNALEKPRDFDPFGQTGFGPLWLQYD